MIVLSTESNIHVSVLSKDKILKHKQPYVLNTLVLQFSYFRNSNGSIKLNFEIHM